MDQRHPCLCAVLSAWAALVVSAASCAAETPGEALGITVGENEAWPVVTLENSVFKSVIRLNPGGGSFGNEHAIRDWVIKSIDQDQVSAYMDASSNRPPLRTAVVIAETASAATVRLEYADGPEGEVAAVSRMTIFADSPVIRIDYDKYPPWTNTVDIGEPGGLKGEEGETLLKGAKTRIFGQEQFESEYGRKLQYHEQSYWNTYDSPYKETDPADGGPLSYKGHLIMAVANEATGVGFGRVMPVKRPGKGGVKILKLLWNHGFECFSATGEAEREPFTGYIYVFTTGLDDAMGMGRRIAEGDMLVGHSKDKRE